MWKQVRVILLQIPGKESAMPAEREVRKDRPLPGPRNRIGEKQFEYWQVFIDDWDLFEMFPKEMAMET